MCGHHVDCLDDFSHSVVSLFNLAKTYTIGILESLNPLQCLMYTNKMDHTCHRLIQNQVNILAVSFISEENQMTCINPSICHLQIT
jgi:hypothetical protein